MIKGLTMLGSIPVQRMPKCPGRLHVFLVALGNGLATRNAGVGDPLADAERKNQIQYARAQDQKKHDGEQDEREGQLDVGQRHDGIVQAAAEVTGKQAEQRAKRAAQQDGHAADQQ